MEAVHGKKRSTAEIMIPCILFFCAATLRLYSALAPGIIVPDGITYINTAKLIDAGEWREIAQYSFYNLYPFFIAMFHKVIPDWELAARVLSVLSGSLAVVPFYWIIKRLFDVKLAVAASVFFIISPRLVEYSSNVIREPVFWLFSLSALSSAAAGIQKRQPVLMVLSALFTGLSAFTRMEGLAVIPIVVFWAFWQYRGERVFTFRNFMVYSIIFTMSFPVLFFAPLVFVKGRLGHWEFGHVGSKIPQILNADNKASEQSYQKNVEDSDVVTRVLTGNKYLAFLWQAIFKFFRSYHVLFVLLFIVGVTRRKIVPYNSREILIWSWFLAFFAVSVMYVSRIYYLSTRHGMLMGLPAFLWVATGFYEIVGALEKWGKGVKFSILRRSKKGIVILTMAVICAIVLPSSLSWSGADKLEMKKAGIYLKDTGLGKMGKLAVESRLIRVAFYADMDYIVLPSGINISQLKEFLDLNKVNVVIIDERTIDTSIEGFMRGFETINLKKVVLPELNTYKQYSIKVFKRAG